MHTYLEGVGVRAAVVKVDREAVFPTGAGPFNDVRPGGGEHPSREGKTKPTRI